MSKRVYLFELDSVRRTDEEIITAQRTLYDEIVENGNVVVMTYNQIVDSRGFLSLFSNPAYQENILALFREGYLQISQFGDIRTVTQYLIGAMEQEKEFYFSALPIKYSQKHLMALVKRSLIYSDLTELAGYLSGGKRTPQERDALFEETGGAVLVKDDEQKAILENLYGLLETIQKISIMDAIHIPPRDPAEYVGLHMYDFLRIALGLQMPDDPLWEKAVSIIQEVIQKIIQDPNSRNMDDRSVYLRRIRSESEKHSAADLAPYQYAEVIVDLCVNYAYEASIADVSKHYDTEELLQNGASSQTFRSDFTARLFQNWDGGSGARDRFLQPDTNEFVPFMDLSLLPDFSLAVRCTKYAPAKDVVESVKRVDGYESGLKHQKKLHRRKLLHAAAVKFAYALLCLIIVCVLSLAMDLPQDLLGVSIIGGGAFTGLLTYLVFLFLAELITWFISKFTHGRIDSLSESLGQMIRYLKDFFRILSSDSAAYINEDMVGKDFSERRNGTVPIDFVVSGALKKYRKLRAEHSSGMLFAQPSTGAYRLKNGLRKAELMMGLHLQRTLCIVQKMQMLNKLRRTAHPALYCSRQAGG